MLRVLAVLIAALLTVSACTGSDAVDQSAASTFKFHGATKLGEVFPQSQRKPAADFDGKLLDGGTFSLASTKGKVVVLNFWGSWCPPCRTELPQFDLLYRKVKSRGVAFVGVDTKDAKGNAENFVRTNDITFPSIYDEPGEVAVRLGNLPAVSLPFTVLVDQQGKVAAVYVQRMSYDDLKTALDKLLAER
ncbi:MAG TPA: TlpA disulfide reductase family protein [Jatrophihabitans sp.]|nr:TlpA disulfide reductase family protein [Jatrophihabitans sp.]